MLAGDTAPAVGPEAARLERLEEFDILDTPSEESFDRVARLISQIFGVEIGIDRQPLHPRDLLFLTARIGRGQVGLRLVLADGLGDLEALGQHEDERSIDIVDALPK